MKITNAQIMRAERIVLKIEALQRDIDPEVLSAVGLNLDYFLEQARNDMVLVKSEMLAVAASAEDAGSSQVDKKP